jgi:5-formyltetrahydrofolate cyclo-ligase
LLDRVRPEAPLIALAYECQLFPELAVSPHDVYMDKVVTERAVYPGRGRRGR